MKKFLLAENTDKAEAFITRIENEYISSIRTLISGLKALGIENIEKALLIDIINGKYERARDINNQAASKDVDNFTSTAARSLMKTVIEERLEDFLKQTIVIFSGEIDNVSLDDKRFQEYFSLDESGNPFIPDQIKEAISEKFREYISSPKVAKVYEAHQTMAKDLQIFVDSLAEAKMDAALYVGPAAPWRFISACFDVEATKDADETIVGIKISPRQINYNLQNE